MTFFDPHRHLPVGLATENDGHGLYGIFQRPEIKVTHHADHFTFHSACAAVHTEDLFFADMPELQLFNSLLIENDRGGVCWKICRKESSDHHLILHGLQVIVVHFINGQHVILCRIGRTEYVLPVDVGW